MNKEKTNLENENPALSKGAVTPSVLLVGEYKHCNCAAPKPIGIFSTLTMTHFPPKINYQCSQCLGIYVGSSNSTAG